MKTVWIAFNVFLTDGWDSKVRNLTVDRVFSTLEKAQEWLEKAKVDHRNVIFEEYEVDEDAN